jgi:tetratricopeptide (TPR) repeat protein
VIAQEEEAGSADSLLVTVDRLVAKLLSLQAGEGPQRLEVLTTTSLPALRAYLDGQAAFRSGHFGRASESFGHALEIDSTFALSALGQWMAGSWGEGPPFDAVRINRIMSTYRSRLGPVDRALVGAVTGEPHSTAERLAEYEAVLKLAPDRADAWFLYGDVMTHWGQVAGHLDAVEQSDAAFSRVLQLDSTYMPALSHRMDNASMLRRLDVYRQLDEIRQRRDPEGGAVLYQKSSRVYVLGDTVAMAAERAAIDTMSVDQLFLLTWIGGLGPGSVDAAVLANERLTQRAATNEERVRALATAAHHYLSYGMPARANRAFDQQLQLPGETLPIRVRQILAALYGDVDAGSARRAALDIPGLMRTEMSAVGRVRASCALEQWRLWNGDASTHPSTAEQLARVPDDSVAAKHEAELCVAALATIYAVVMEPSRLSAQVGALDALMRDGPRINTTFRNAFNIILGRAAERAGDRKLAYHAMARIPWHPAGGLFTDVMTRESARLAALNGDTERAIRDYTNYLLLHERAEPALKAEDNAARAHLAQLTAER